MGAEPNGWTAKMNSLGTMRYSKQIDQEALARRGNAKREREGNKFVKLETGKL